MRSILSILVPGGLAVLTLLGVPTRAEGGTLRAWLRADRGIALQDNSATGGTATDVAAWADQSAEGNDVAQAVALAQPTLVANGLHGRPVVRFAEADQEFLTTSLTNAFDFNRGTTFLVASFASVDRITAFELNPATTAGDLDGFAVSRGGVLDRLFAHHWNGDGSGTAGGSRLQTSEVPLSSGAHLVRTTHVKASAALDIFVDGADTNNAINQVVTTNLDDVNSLTVGARGVGNLWYMQGDVAEVIVFDDVLDADTITGIEHLLGVRYGLTTPTATSQQIALAEAALGIPGVPEPSAVTLLAGTSLLMLSRRRRARR